MAKQEAKLQRQMEEKDREIFRLQEQAKSAGEKQALAVAEAERKKDGEIGELKMQLMKQQSEADKKVWSLQEEQKRELADRILDEIRKTGEGSQSAAD